MKVVSFEKKVSGDPSPSVSAHFPGLKPPVATTLELLGAATAQGRRAVELFEAPFAEFSPTKNERKRMNIGLLLGTFLGEDRISSDGAAFIFKTKVIFSYQILLELAIHQLQEVNAKLSYPIDGLDVALGDLQLVIWPARSRRRLAGILMRYLGDERGGENILELPEEE